MYPDIFVVHLLSLLEQRPGLRVLDVGSGTGRNSIFVAQGGHLVTALDHAPRMLVNGLAASQEQGVTIAFLAGRAEALPFIDDAFDVLLCTSVLESLTASAARQVARGVRRVLRPRGYLLIVTAAQEGSEADGAAVEDSSTTVPFKARLTAKEELLSWFPGFAVIELLHLQLEYPTSPPVRAQWALVARRLPG